jgi:ParB family chromosome partitioning protein
MQEMVASIRARGVKTPVSVRSHPKKPGKWMLNYGARRYRGSLAAGRKTIPAFVDEAHNDYDQVIENIQRDDLKPMELALFIKKRLDAGDKKQVIAKNLGKDAATITQHLALIDPPPCIEEAYSAGKCVSPKTLYELRVLYEKYPDQVGVWCAGSTEITRKAVADLAADLKSKEAREPEAGEPGSDANGQAFPESDHEKISDGSEEGQRRTSESGTGEDLDERSSLPERHSATDRTRMSRPLLLVEFDGRSAAVLLNCRPTTPGLIHIRFEDGGGDQEVDAGACKINLLTDAP